MLLSGPILLAALFMSWSHQFSRAFLAQYGSSPALQGVPRNPTAWQIYSAADLLLALLGLGLVGAALRGTRNWRLGLVIPLVVAVAFTIHALSVPPTNGADIFDAARGAYVANSPAAGPGEVVALLALVMGLGGVLLSFTAD